MAHSGREFRDKMAGRQQARREKMANRFGESNNMRVVKDKKQGKRFKKAA